MEENEVELSPEKSKGTAMVRPTKGRESRSIKLRFCCRKRNLGSDVGIFSVRRGSSDQYRRDRFGIHGPKIMSAYEELHLC